MSIGDDLTTDLSQGSGWYALLPPPTPANRLVGTQSADWVIVGAGVTGLAAARRLGEHLPEARIILLESSRLGFGASGRNSGFIIDAPSYTEGFDADYNRRLMHLFRTGHKALKSLIQDHDIACNWSQTGHFCAVANPRRTPVLEAVCRSLDAVGDDYEWLEGSSLETTIGTTFYHAAIRLPRTILMNPAALCRGLGETLPSNVELYEESPVVKIHADTRIQIDCAQGVVNADRLILATNAATPELGYLKREILPIMLYASLSKPLSQEQQAAMSGASEWGITPKIPMGSTIRRVGNRMAIRNVVRRSSDIRLTPDLKVKLQATHRQLLTKRFPMLDGLEMDYSWGGVIAMTRNYSSVFGRLESGIFAAMAYNGVGLARGTASGMALVDYALGGESDVIDAAMALAGPSRFPPRPFLDLGVAANLAWKRFRVGIDR